MPERPSRRTAVAILAAITLLVGAVPIVSAAHPTRGLTVISDLSPSGRITGFKSVSAGNVRSDPALVARTDATPVNVMIKLDFDAVASYAGGIGDLAATSPRVTGRPLTGKTNAEKKYRAHIKSEEAAFVKAFRAKVPNAKVGQSYETVYGGISARIPAKSVKDVLKIPGVVAVQADELRQLLTDSSPDFIDASPLYPGLGGTSNAGRGVIYGNLDSGVWPEHPSFADQGNLGAPPAKGDGTPRECDFGDNPLTVATDVFVCNHKLIGGAAFLEGYNAAVGGEVYTTARDSNGHGSHTASTTAGNAIPSAPVLGTERGPINGIAPGAWLSVYKVCGAEGCADSDSAAAVQQAILDGVDVINFSISGGTSPFSDPVELAFLDAYAAGVLVSTSAGNEGPGASTANHLSPWVVTTAASTQTREFSSTLTVTGSGGATFVTHGASITAGAGPLPLVRASAAPYSHVLCDVPAAPGTFTGKIVACQRGVVGRVEKSFNVAQGGAAGMVLYNPTLADVETDNHWVPTVHLADGTGLVAFLNANPVTTASFTAGVSQDGVGDVMAAFSSRGPAGLFVKPDVTAPGVEILAGMTPTPESVVEGPPGQYFQAIAGTSMSSPHVAGAAILLRAKHPSWTPGQIKSALMTSATTDVVKEDLVTPADPFDFGSGRIDVDDASAVKLTFDETAADYFQFGGDSLQAIDLNVPSINAPILPGKVTTWRTAKNVTRSTVEFKITTKAPPGSTISVKPSTLKLKPGQSKSFKITIATSAPAGEQQFGKIVLTQKVKRGHSGQRLHLPVAFIHQQGDVSLSQSCAPTSVRRNATTSCTVVATNLGFETQRVSTESRVNDKLDILSAVGAKRLGKDKYGIKNVELTGATVGVPSVGPAGFEGYLPLDLFGVTPTAVGDEDILNFNVPAFQYNGVTYDAVGVDTNGYLVAGGATSEDNNCCTLPAGPSPDRPNDVLAPFWTDLNGEGADGIFAATLTDGVNRWIVIEWRVFVFGTPDLRIFQTWIGVNGVQDITMNYDPAQLPYADPNSQAFLVGAENSSGGGQMDAVLPTEDLVVTSTDPAPGESVTYTMHIKGKKVGLGQLTTSMVADGVLGTTIVRTDIPITH